MRRLLTVFLFVSLGYCMNDGDSVEWNRYAYIVKVLSTISENQTVACTGTIVAPSLVITSSRCFQDVTDESLNAVILSVRGDGTKAWNRKVHAFKTEGDFAVLQIKPRTAEKLCPAPPVPVRLARLPLDVTLIKSSWSPIDKEIIEETKCRIIGFETVDINDFTTNHTLLHTLVTLSSEMELMTAIVKDGRGACWDDIGLPVECELSETKWTQIGMLHSVTSDEQDEDSEKEVTCQDITGMRFSIFSESDVGFLLNSMGAGDVFATYKKCFH